MINGDDQERLDELKRKDEVNYWSQEIKDSVKREKQYRKDAKLAVSIFESEETEKLPFNILYSNTETLRAVLYNSLPRPHVTRRFNKNDVMGKFAAQIANRWLEYFLDSNDREVSDFDDLMRNAVVEALVAGRGITRFRYEAETAEQPAPVMEGEEPRMESVLKWESVTAEEVPWDRIYFGYAKRWSQVPWLAFEHFMTKEELKTNFPEDFATIPLMVSEHEGKSRDEEMTAPRDMGDATLARIYEIWDKTKREVIFFCPDKADNVIKKLEDPLQLSGFFPIPRPLCFAKRITSLVPNTLFSYYEAQNRELNSITVRINKIVKAIKVRGAYDSSVEGLEKILDAEDNVLIPADNIASMQDNGTLEKAIWLVPIEKLTSVLQQLYVQREQVKSIIYEITAIADIMRGESQASETLGAQQLKSQWGSLRIKKEQKEAQRYVRDCLRIAAEICFKHCGQQTISEIVGMQIPTNAEKQQAQMIMQQKQMQIQQQMQMAQMSGQPPPRQPPPPQELLLALNLPTWEELLKMLRDDLHRNYKIDIETNSTIELEATEDKKDVSEFLNALAQFLNGVFPMTEVGILPFDALKEILGAVTRRFKFGTDVEEALEKMQAPQPKEVDAAKAQGEQQKMQAEQQKMQIEQQKAQMDIQLKQKELEARFAALMQEAQLGKIEADLQLKELQRKDELAIAKHESQLRMIAMKAVAAEKQDKEKTNASV